MIGTNAGQLNFPDRTASSLSEPAASREPAPSCLESLREYVTTRFADDAHVDGTVLYREVVGLGFDRSYVTFVRQVHLLGLRPRWEACRTGGHRVAIELTHTPGEGIGTGLSSPRPPGVSRPMSLSARSRSLSKCRAVISEGMTFAHLVEAIGSGPAQVGRRHASVANRPNGDRCLPGHGPDHEPVRTGRLALRGRGMDLPTQASAAKRRHLKKRSNT